LLYLFYTQESVPKLIQFKNVQISIREAEELFNNRIIGSDHWRQNENWCGVCL